MFIDYFNLPTISNVYISLCSVTEQAGKSRRPTSASRILLTWKTAGEPLLLHTAHFFLQQRVQQKISFARRDGMIIIYQRIDGREGAVPIRQDVNLNAVPGCPPLIGWHRLRSPSPG
jgi:hypothetical protein